MEGKNRQRITSAPDSFEKSLIKIEDCREIGYHGGGICGIYHNFMNERWSLLTRTQSDLQTL